MSVPLNALKKAPVLDQSGAGLVGSKYTVTSSNPGAVTVTTSGGAYYVVGVAAGTSTITATRTLDGAVATLDVEVLAATPFSITLGAESPA